MSGDQSKLNHDRLRKLQDRDARDPLIEVRSDTMAGGCGSIRSAALTFLTLCRYGSEMRDRMLSQM